MKIIASSGIFAFLTTLTLLHSQAFGQSSSAQQTDAANQSATPIVGSLQLRDHRIEFNADNTYTIYNHTGTVLAEEINLAQLQAKHPELYEVLEPAIAEDSIIDASVHLSK